MEPSVPKRAKFGEDGKTNLENEVNFEYWEMLPLEIRCMIAKETDIMTRFSLMFSSKSNYQIARSVPIKIESITIRNRIRIEHPDVDLSKSRIAILLQKYDPSELITTIYFVDCDGGTKVYRWWKKNEEFCTAKTIFLANLTYYEASKLFVERLLELTDYQVEEFQLTVELRDDLVFLEKLRVKKKLCILSRDGCIFQRLLTAASTPLEKLELRIPDDENDCLWDFEQFDLNHNTIRNAKELIFSNDADLHESLDFCQLNCDKFYVFTKEVTPWSVNQFVKKWINGNVPANFSRADFSGWNLTFDRYSERDLLRDIDTSPWHHEYRVGDKRLNEFFDEIAPRDSNCYYIETKTRNNGAALFFGVFRVVLLVAGRQNRIEQGDILQ